MKKAMVIILVLALLALIVFSYYKLAEQGEKAEGKEAGEAGEVKPEEIKKAEQGIEKADGEVSEGTVEEDKEELPPDLYTAECGYYFAKYGICAGTCPEGQCIKEGRSCYCKRV